jgi:hypothetical protein
MDRSGRIIGLALLGCLALGLRFWMVLAPPAPAPALAAVAAESPADAPRAADLLLPRTVQFLQCLAGAALVLAVAWLGWSLAPDRSSIGWMAALAAAVYPGHVAAVVSPQAALWAALAVTCLLALAVSPRGQSPRRDAVMAGSLAGAAILLQPILVLAAPICAAAFWWSEGRQDRGERLRPRALGRLAIFAGVAAALVGCWSAGSRLSQHGSAVEQAVGATGSEAAANDRQLPTCDLSARHAPVCLERLRVFLLSGENFPLPPGEGQGVRANETRLARFAAIACLVLALMGCSIGWRRWPMFWPTYAIVVAVALADMFGVIPAGSRLPLEPLALVWSALAIAPPLVRLLPGRSVRVYRPGERGEDPLDHRQLLRGPHYDVGVRRRAG